MRTRRIAPAFALIFPGLVSTYACGVDDTVLTAQPSGGDATTSDVTISYDDAPSISDTSTSDAAAHDSSADSEASTSPTPQLVYANTQSDLFSFDVVTDTLTHLAALSETCGDNQNDIAVDSSGNLFIFESSDAIYALTLTGTCAGRDQLSSDGNDTLQIASRFAGTPAFIAIDTSHKDIYSLDPASTPTANLTTITSSYFPAAPKYDVTCSKSGTCWTALDNSKCSAGSSSSCLFSFPADGSGTPTSLGAIGVHPTGLAYANNFLYGFDDDGSIVQISLSAPPLATVIAVKLAASTTQPDAWNGAGSSSAY